MTADHVIDASVMVLALVGKDAAADELRARMSTWRLHAPHLIDAEIGNVLRRHERRGLISAAEARTALHSAEQLIEYRYPHTGPLARAAWQRRGSITFYDALYVALAARLDLPLVTADRRLRDAPGLDCTVHLV